MPATSCACSAASLGTSEPLPTASSTPGGAIRGSSSSRIIVSARGTSSRATITRHLPSADGSGSLVASTLARSSATTTRLASLVVERAGDGHAHPSRSDRSAATRGTGEAPRSMHCFFGRWLRWAAVAARRRRRRRRCRADARLMTARCISFIQRCTIAARRVLLLDDRLHGPPGDGAVVDGEDDVVGALAAGHGERHAAAGAHARPRVLGADLGLEAALVAADDVAARVEDVRRDEHVGAAPAARRRARTRCTRRGAGYVRSPQSERMPAIASGSSCPSWATTTSTSGLPSSVASLSCSSSRSSSSSGSDEVDERAPDLLVAELGDDRVLAVRLGREPHGGRRERDALLVADADRGRLARQDGLGRIAHLEGHVVRARAEPEEHGHRRDAHAAVVARRRPSLALP